MVDIDIEEYTEGTWATAIATGVAYGIMLGVMTALLFGIPYLIFRFLV